MAIHGWATDKIERKTDTGGILLHAALGAVGGGLGARLGHQYLQDRKIAARWKERPPVNKFEEVATETSITGTGHTVPQVIATFGRSTLSDEGLFPTAVPMASIGRVE